MKQFDRKRPFSLNLFTGETNEGQKLHSLIPIGDSLFAFSSDSINEILLAETIDPENNHPDTRHSFQKIFSIGTRDSLVARTIIQFNEILNSLILEKGQDKKKILAHVWHCSQLLFNCEKAFYSIFSQCKALVKECDQLIEKHKQTAFIPPLPQVSNLEAHVVSFLGYAKRFLEGTHQLFGLFFGTPNFEANFQRYIDWLKAERADLSDLIAQLIDDHDWIKHLAWCRNALDANHSSENFKISIFNIKLRPGNKFITPAWQYDFSGKEAGRIQSEPVDLLIDMNTYLYNLLSFFEEIFLLSIREVWDKRFKFGISKNKDDELNPECPMLYFISLKELPAGLQKGDVQSPK